jgi:dihydroorotate dehydrogenase (fumarate)
MTSLQTQYLGLNLASPIVVGACSLSKRIDAIRALEDAGAGALVIKSLFEEQIQFEQSEFEASISQHDNAFQEAMSMFPRLSHAGAKEHVFWVKKTRKEVTMPLIASLNCVARDAWVEYAVQLAETGVDALELNFYSHPRDASLQSGDIEKYETDVVAKICAAVKIPVSVKLHPFYTNLYALVQGMEKAGARGFVLFNRLFQPDINVQKVETRASVHLSSPSDALPALRWTALLHDKVDASFAASGGVESGVDAVKMLLVGAHAVQVVSTLYRNGNAHVKALNEDIVRFMREHNYRSIDEFRGLLGKRKATDAWSFERGQYIKAILGFD